MNKQLFIFTVNVLVNAESLKDAQQYLEWDLNDGRNTTSHHIVEAKEVTPEAIKPMMGMEHIDPIMAGLLQPFAPAPKDAISIENWGVAFEALKQHGDITSFPMSDRDREIMKNSTELECTNFAPKDIPDTGWTQEMKDVRDLTKEAFTAKYPELRAKMDQIEANLDTGLSFSEAGQPTAYASQQDPTSDPKIGYPNMATVGKEIIYELKVDGYLVKWTGLDDTEWMNVHSKSHANSRRTDKNGDTWELDWLTGIAVNIGKSE